MKKPVTSWQKITGIAPPEWDRPAVARFGIKFASSLVLMESSEWIRFSDKQCIEWDAYPIKHISGKADPVTTEQQVTPAGVPTKALIEFAERSVGYFYNYSCTTHIYAAKSCVTLRNHGNKLTVGTVWSIF